MKFNSKICTTKEQSKRLLALGLKEETADCVMMYYDGWHIGEAEHFDFDKDPVEPAWSLDRLLKMIPEWISYPTQYDSAPLRINKESMYYLHRFFDRNGDEDTSTVGDNEAIGSHNIYDYAVSVIGFLIREGHFCKEYLED